MGVAHHMNHVAWFEEARTEWLRAQGRSYRDLEDDGYLLQIVELQCRYHAPLDYDDVVVIETSLIRRRRVGITLGYRLTRETDGVLAATGETSLACVSPEGKLRALPEDLFEGGKLA